jgi:hypothetical protein
VWSFGNKPSPKEADTPYVLAEPKPQPRPAPKKDTKPAPTEVEWSTAVANHDQLVSPDGAIVTLSGTCPRCDHQMSVELPIKARSGKGATLKLDNQSLGKKSFLKVAFCNCGSAHEGRPDDCPDGCGAFGALLVGGEEPMMERCISVVGKPHRAAVHDVKWERQAETEAGQTLTTARAGAEKWTQTIAALTGVFSIVLVVKGPTDISKVQGVVDLGLPGPPSWLTWVSAIAAVLLLALVATLTFGHFRNALGRHGRWVRWLLLASAILLVAALVAVWADESWSHFTLIEVLLAAAVVLAATAIITGGLAAFGLPSRFVAASGAILRHRQTKHTLLTRSLLRGSLYVATVTVAVVGAAIVVTWTQTGSATPDPVLVVRSAGEGAPVLCGPSESVDLPGGMPPVAVAVDTSKGKEMPVPVPVAQIRLLATVSSCGAGTP